MNMTVVPSKNKPSEVTVVSIKIGFGDVFMITLRTVLSLALIAAAVGLVVLIARQS